MTNINKAIEMIAHFRMNGEVRPIRFRVVDETDEEQVIAIKHIYCVETEKQSRENVILKFSCKIQLGDFYRTCEIHYLVFEPRWVLAKI